MEDQTQLTTARLQLLEKIIADGSLHLLYRRNDMVIFTLYARNVACGLVSLYYRLKEQLDIRFFVHFHFDEWLHKIQHWQEMLAGDEYRVDPQDKVGIGRAKRLTIVIDKTFGYDTDSLPMESSEGSKALADDDILPPLRHIGDMTYGEMVNLLHDALDSLHDNLLRIAMLPIKWTEDERKMAFGKYQEGITRNANVQNELTDYEYFCAMPNSSSVTSQMCYLRQRILQLMGNGELDGLLMSKSQQQELLAKLRQTFNSAEINPPEDLIPTNAALMADDELFAKFLFFVDLSKPLTFPVLNVANIANYLIRKDVSLSSEQESHLQSLIALMQAMDNTLTPLLAERNTMGGHADELQKRIDSVLAIIHEYNACLSPLIAKDKGVAALDSLFASWFSPALGDHTLKAQKQLLKLLEKGRGDIKIETYVHLLQQASEQRFFKDNSMLGIVLYKALKDKISISEDSFKRYFSNHTFVNEPDWKEPIKLITSIS